MKTESVPSIKNEAANKTEEKTITQERSKLTSLVSKIKENYPAFEKVIETPGKIARLITMLAVLEGGQLFAQEIKTTDIKEPFSEEKLINELPNMSMPQITERLKLFKSSFLSNKKILFSRVLGDYVIKKNVQEKEKNNSKNQHSGIIPSDVGVIGKNVGVNTYGRSIKKENSLSKGEQEKFTYEEENSYELEVSNDFTEKEIMETKDTLKISGFGFTKQDAIIDAVENLSRYCQVAISSGNIKIESESNKGEHTTNFASFVVDNSLNFFKNLRVDKIEEKKQGNETIYTAYVSAQKGQLIEK